MCVLPQKPHLSCCHCRTQQCLFIGPYRLGALSSPWLSKGGPSPVSEGVGYTSDSDLGGNAEPGCAQIPWSMKELWAAEQSSPRPRSRGRAPLLSRRSGRGQGGASRGEQSPVQPCLGWGRAVTNQPIIQLLLNQKFIFKQCSGFQDHSRLFRSRQYYIAGLSTPNRDSLQLLAFKQLILQKPSCHSLNFSTFNSSKILSRPHLKAHCCTWSFEGYSERQTSTG